ncbi:hypothetical protein FRC08_003770 [Ceratobasidium sp. 394]|nr:hypothetical protein FRC08_003770 [Ceratobasidium sp. 394]
MDCDPSPLTKIPLNDHILPAANATLNSVLDEWKAARALLASTIQNYLAACTALLTACAKPVYRPEEVFDLEKILVTVNSELGSLVSDETALQDMRMSFVTARNRSTTLTPVNTLPPEILANIFALSGTCFVHNDTQGFYNFTGVCRYWQEIIMNTADLWTHIDVGPEIPERLTKTLLDRSKNMPVHIHLYEKTPRSAFPDRVFGITQMLASHIHRVCTAFLQSNSHSPTLVVALLNLWLTGGSPTLVKSLIVHQPNASGPISINGSSVDALRSRPDNSEAVLGSLRKLHLKNIKFEWDSAAYHGLVDLQLDLPCSFTRIPIPELVKILSANPALSILKLGSLEITTPKNWSRPAPIELHCLRVLNLHQIDAASLQLLLPSITLSTPSVKICIGGTDFSRIHDELEDFVARSSVTELYCYNDYSRSFSTWQSLLGLPSGLRILGFRSFHMNGVPVRGAGMDNPQYLPAADRSSVLLLDCTANLKGLKILLAKHNIRSLHLERCKVYDGRKHYSGDLSISLSEAHSGLTCVVSDTASKEWEHCSMFDR